MADECFVISHIGEEGTPERRWCDLTLKYIVEFVLANEPFNMKVQRSDGVSEPGLITAQIIARLEGARLVVADLSFRNPNAYYELAVRHLLQKPVVHLIRRGEEIPFDNADNRMIIYDLADPGSVDAARTALAEQARFALEPARKLLNPIVSAIGAKALMASASTAEQTMGRMSAQMADIQRRLTHIESRLPVGETITPPFTGRFSSPLGSLAMTAPTCAICGEPVGLMGGEKRSSDGAWVHAGKCPPRRTGSGYSQAP